MPEIPANFTGFADSDRLEPNLQEPVDGVLPWTEIDQSPDYFADLDDEEDQS
jgi:hypothetical protein